MFNMILCTCPDVVSARTIAQHLVESHLAACVKIVPQVESFYLWQNALQHDVEVQLVIKSKCALFDEITAAIKSKHPYDVPEIVAFDIAQGNSTYLDWLEKSLR